MANNVKSNLVKLLLTEGTLLVPTSGFVSSFTLSSRRRADKPGRNGVGMALPGLASGFERAGVATGGASWQVLWRGAFHKKNYFQGCFGSFPDFVSELLEKCIISLLSLIPGFYSFETLSTFVDRQLILYPISI